MKQAAVALIEKNGLFLAVSRKNNSELFGLPGGKVNSGETIEQCMVRELFEETGIKAIKYKEFYCQNKNDGYESTCFLVTEYDGIPFSKEEGIVKWATKEELIDGPFGEYNKKVFSKLNK